MRGPSHTGLAFSRRPVDDKPKRRNGSRPRGIERALIRLHSVGRTVPMITPLVNRAEIEEIAGKFGYERPDDWHRLPAAQQMDLLATHLISRSRGKATQHEYVLSPWQWNDRSAIREIPMTPEQLQAVVNHVPWARVYRGPTRLSKTDMVRHLELLDASDEKALAIKRVWAE